MKKNLNSWLLLIPTIFVVSCNSGVINEGSQRVYIKYTVFGDNDYIYRKPFDKDVGIMTALPDFIKEPLVEYLRTNSDEGFGYDYSWETAHFAGDFEGFVDNRFSLYPYLDDYYAIGTNSILHDYMPIGWGNHYVPSFDKILFIVPEPFYFIEKKEYYEHFTHDDFIPFSEIYALNKISENEFWDLYYSYYIRFNSYTNDLSTDKIDFVDMKKYLENNFSNIETALNARITNFLNSDDGVIPSYNQRRKGQYRYFKYNEVIDSNSLCYTPYQTSFSSSLEKYYKKNKKTLMWNVKIDNFGLERKYVKVKNHDNFQNIIDFGNYSGYELFVSLDSKTRCDDEEGIFTFDSNNYGDEITYTYALESMFNRNLFMNSIRNEIVAFNTRKKALYSLDALYADGIISDEQIKTISMQIYSYFYDNLDNNIDKNEFKKDYIFKWNMFYKFGTGYKDLSIFE